MHRALLCLSTLILVISSVASADTTHKNLRGMFVTDGVTGGAASPHGWSGELVYGVGEKGIGMGARTSNDPQGAFELYGGYKDAGSFAADKFALYSLGYDSIPAFNIRPNLATEDYSGQVDFRSPAHYSVMYNKLPSEWGESPYIDGTDFYQTFVATGRHITRIAVKLGGKSGDHLALTLNYAVYEPNSGPPSTWKRISPIRNRTYAGHVDPIIHIYQVVYRSSEVNLRPGKTYAVRFWRDLSSQAETFVMVARPDHGDGYERGRLYRGDKAMPEWDAYAYVSGGAPGTIVNHAPIGDTELKTLAGAAKRFGQTFKASGKYLAGVDIIYTTGSQYPPSWPITFQVYDKPGGAPIGPARVCYGVQMVYQARAAAFWTQGQVPLIPGRMYYVQWTCPNVCNTWVANEDLPGEAYLDGKIQPKTDLMMSIAEYEGSR